MSLTPEPLTPHEEEALRLLQFADRDIAAFHALQQHSEVEPAQTLFHARQAIEKCFKAVMVARHLPVPRSHDLTNLARRIKDNGLAVPAPARELDQLAPYTVHFRYDEIESDRPPMDVVDAMLIAVRNWANTVAGGGRRGG
jgi:HEPN domain-containing protein